MLLRQKKTQGEDQNWCIILSPIQSELDKKKVAQKLSGVFSLSIEESLDLVANTPIILLDNLTRSVASKLKDFFRAAGADTVLTNDVFQKRKCYRTVWPEQPNLSFLHNWSTAKTESHEEQLPPEKVLDEIRTMAHEEKKPKPALTPMFSRDERDQLVEELERWRRESMNLREELKQMKDQLDRVQKENILDLERDEEGEWSEEKDKDLKEARMLLEHANEKYEVLREEYANARHLYEEKITAMLQESENAKRSLKETGDALKALQTQKQSYEEQLAQKDRDIQILMEENRKTKLSYEQKMAKNLDEMSRVQLQNKDVNEKLAIFQKDKEQLELTVNTQAEQISYWHDRHDAVVPKLVNAERKAEEEKLNREKIENRHRDLEKSHMRLIQEIEEKAKMAHDWEIKCLEFDKQIAELREAYQNQEKILQNNFRQLETRERELEMARRQVREVNAQIEQREAAQKRTILSAQLVEKEAILKKLVKDQEKIESEIKEREESIRSILSQQEAVEKDIVEAKQAQRHLAEVAKRDQKGKVRISRDHHEAESPEQDLPEND